MLSLSRLHILRTSKRLLASSIDPIQAKYLEEPCIEVNQEDDPIGCISKRDCHTKPILHRAFSVFIFNPERKLLLQKRSSTKITFPGVWTNSCCSHPHHNEIENNQLVGVKLAAKRKLMHELGIVAKTNEMRMMGRFIYKANSDEQWVEHEIDYAICIPNFNASIERNPEEVSEVRYVSQQELEDMFTDVKLKFSPWFSLFSSFQWLNLWWTNLEKLDTYTDLKNIHKLN